MRPGKSLIIPSIFFFSGFSFATTQPLVTIGELEAQQNRNILLQAKVQGAQLQKQLEESDVNLSSETVSGFSGMTASLPSVSEQPTSKNRKELPVIMEINVFMPFFAWLMDVRQASPLVASFRVHPSR